MSSFKAEIADMSSSNGTRTDGISETANVQFSCYPSVSAPPGQSTLRDEDIIMGAEGTLSLGPDSLDSWPDV